jgi:hypothetical protein
MRPATGRDREAVGPPAFRLTPSWKLATDDRAWGIVSRSHHRHQFPATSIACPQRRDRLPLSHHESGFPSLDFKATELIRGFLLHVLPLCFVRIRHYGFLANRVRQEKLALCRLLLNDNAMPETISVSKRAGRGTWRGECLRIV